MKRGIMKTAIGVFLAAVVAFCISVPAYAMSGELAGSSLLFTYYDVRSTAAGGLGLTDNYFTVTNTATDKWVQAHLRVRTGPRSVELLDFDILLSPADVFTFELYDNAGATEFASCDTKTLINSGFNPNFNRDGNTATGDAQGDDCYVLNSSSFPQMLGLIAICEPDLTDAEILAQTKQGYVEIIGEGIIRALNFYNPTASKEKCRGILPADNTDDVTIAGKMLEHCTNDTLSLDQACPNGDVVNMESVLIGRQYYASVSSGVVTRVAQVNAEVLDDDNAPLTLHCESFSVEAASPDCVAADSGPCYAYVDPVAGDTVANGADDMNRCFYDSTILVANDVANKFGAGATYGPTIADIVEDYQRNGSLSQTATALDYIMGWMNDGYYTYNGGGFGSDGNKQYADSHYFAIPSFDVVTSFAFIFPLQHFIGEKNLVTPLVIFDNEENSQTIDLGKFISPGLPTPSSPANEAQLFKLNAPFTEGWVRWKVTATNSTNGCTETLAGGASCEVNSEVAEPTETYVPAYTGAVFNVGSQFISSSHFQYNNDGLTR